MKPGYLHGTDCRPAAEILSRIGDKWSVMLVMELHGGTKRFSELRRALAGISQKMLTASLRGLERDGFVTRTIYPTIPPKVEYELTELGQSLIEPLKVLKGWAVESQAAIEMARIAFDNAAQAEHRQP